jgi:hypothetical protein
MLRPPTLTTGGSNSARAVTGVSISTDAAEATIAENKSCAPGAWPELIWMLPEEVMRTGPAAPWTTTVDCGLELVGDFAVVTCPRARGAQIQAQKRIAVQSAMEGEEFRFTNRGRAAVFILVTNPGLCGS